jgi:transposase
MNPPDNALVLSVDEKTQIQALDRTQPVLQLRPGQIERRTHDSKRYGTRSLYAALNTAAGQAIGQVASRHRAKKFMGFLRKIDRGTPSELDLHVILDNSSTHKTADVRAWLAKHVRFHVHFTPTSGSWLNAVEQWFGKLAQRSLQRGAHTSVEALTADIYRHIDAHNEYSAKPFNPDYSRDFVAKARFPKRIADAPGTAQRGALAVRRSEQRGRKTRGARKASLQQKES